MIGQLCMYSSGGQQLKPLVKQRITGHSVSAGCCWTISIACTMDVCSGKLRLSLPVQS